MQTDVLQDGFTLCARWWGILHFIARVSVRYDKLSHEPEANEMSHDIVCTMSVLSDLFLCAASITSLFGLKIEA